MAATSIRSAVFIDDYLRLNASALCRHAGKDFSDWAACQVTQRHLDKVRDHPCETVAVLIKDEWWVESKFQTHFTVWLGDAYATAVMDVYERDRVVESSDEEEEVDPDACWILDKRFHWLCDLRAYRDELLAKQAAL